MSGWLRGVIKEVPSGDCVVVVSSAQATYAGIQPQATQLRQEKRLILSGISAPRVGRRDGSTQDEQWAWASRENLRKRLVGNNVVFRVDDVIQDKNLEFSTVFDSSNQNAAVMQVASGYAKAKEGSKNEAHQQLKEAEEHAKAKGLGMWSFDGDKKSTQTKSKRKVTQVGDAVSADSLVSKSKAANRKRFPCIVESVGNPHVLKVLIESDESEDPATASYVSATVFLCGVACPLVQRRAPKEGDEKAAPAGPEAFSVRSKVFVETAVLGKDCEVVFEDLDKYGNLYVSLYSQTGSGGTAPTESVQDLLLKEGLARILDWSARMLPSLAASKQRQAEKAAKAGKKNIWHAYVPQQDGAGAAGAGGDFKAVVCEVVSGDTLTLYHLAEKREMRVHLSSLRAPRMPSRANNNVGEPWAEEAREVLRNKLIGKEVTARVEYTRKVPVGGPAPQGANPADQQQRTLTFAKVTYEERKDGVVRPVSVAEVLLARGLALTQKHRSSDNTAENYEDLIEAEAKAQKNKKGIHGGKKPAMQGARLNDLSQGSSAAKSKQFLPFLQRSERVSAVVDYVLSGHRLKLRVPKQALALTFALSDVRCPGRNKPYSDDALRYARLHCMQRDVEIEIEGIDKIGTFVGKLRIVSGNRRVDLSEQLVANGLATVQGYNVPSGSPLLVAQYKAKQNRTNLWKDYKEPEPEEAGASSSSGAGAQKRIESIKIRAVNVVSGGVFYAQKADDATSSLLEEIGSLSLGQSSGDQRFANKETCLCKYAGDNQLYRARVERYDDKTKTYDVFYLDFGNRDRVAAKDMAPIGNLGIKSSSPLAFACKLAWIKPPTLEEDYGYEAAEFLQTMIGGGQVLVCQVEERASEVVQGKKAETVAKVILSDPATNEMVQMEMVKNGLARVERVPKFKEISDLVKTLREEEEVAKKDHLNIWQYGDIGSDDEDGPPAWGRR